MCVCVCVQEKDVTVSMPAATGAKSVRTFLSVFVGCVRSAPERPPSASVRQLFRPRLRELRGTGVCRGPAAMSPGPTARRQPLCCSAVSRSVSTKCPTARKRRPHARPRKSANSASPKNRSDLAAPRRRGGAAFAAVLSGLQLFLRQTSPSG